MILLGISAFYHDSAVAIIKDEEILYAAQEERFSRVKNDDSFPILALLAGLEQCNLSIEEIDGIAFYDKPFLKFERIIENHLDYIPYSMSNFIKTTPAWINKKLFIERTITKELKKAGLQTKKKFQYFYPEHHLSHAASVYYTSPFKNATIITIDGVGEYNTTAIFEGNEEKITKKAVINYPHSLGLLYSAFTYFLGFEVNKGEYKMMGLAPYGNLNHPETTAFINTIKTHLITIKEDASFTLNMDYFSFTKGKKMIETAQWEKLLGITKRETELNQSYANLALAIQSVTEEIVTNIVLKGIEITGSRNVCFAGGIALNSVINGKLAENYKIDNLFVFPAPGDAGGAVGAALAAFYIGHIQKRKILTPDLKNGLLGTTIKKEELGQIKKLHPGKVLIIEDQQELCALIAKEIIEDKIVGWVQGRMEFGPRALGARSILANPYSSKTQKHVNLRIKKRESFRPFAPILLEEDLQEIVPTCKHSKYMLQVHKISDVFRKKVSQEYKNLEWKEKLYTEKSHFPAITHVDFSARVQSVHKDNENSIRDLLLEIKRLTGYGILVNTSFNSSNEPIVCSAQDAYDCFVQNGIDILVMENTIFYKND